MPQYIVSQFDSDTFVVVRRKGKQEVCVCSNYDLGTNARGRACQIAKALNAQSVRNLKARRKQK